MNDEETPKDRQDTSEQKPPQPVIPRKKRKREPEVTIAPSGPGGPDISIDPPH